MKPNEHKFTDEEVIEALQCCRTIDGNDCSTCPYNGGKYEIGSGGCSNHLVNDAIDLINRQKAEIEELIYKLELLLCQTTGSKLSKHTYTLETMVRVSNDYINESYDEGYSEGYSEAIKEYLAKVLEKKDIAGHYMPGHAVVSVSVLEACAKEMMEEKE